MKTIKNIPNQLRDTLLVFIGASGVLIPVCPINMQYTLRDSGVFLYIGWRILNGELPYRDVWDHKPPVIFYINALGLSLTEGSRWGVWLLEFISLFIAAYIGYKILQKIFGTLTAIFSTLLWLLTLVYVIHGGNFTTEYVLPLQFITLWLAKTTFEHPTSQNWKWFLIGLIGATAFFTKQNTIGIWISVILFVIVYRVGQNQLKKLLFHLLYFSGGFVVICMSWVTFFWLRGGLLHFWEAAFQYNLVYFSSGIDSAGPIKPLIEGIWPLTKAGLFQFAGIGYLIGLLMIYYKKQFIGSWLPLLGIGLIDLPVELILVSISGRTYPHYYITILPVLAFFAAITIWTILSSKLVWDIPEFAKYLLIIDSIGLFVWISFAPYMYELAFFRSANEQREIITTIQFNTNPEDTVLLWGAETTINFYSGRRSPSRFVYQYPLYNQGYVTEEMIVGFLDEIIKENPRLIIDTHNSYTPLYKFPIQTNAIQQRIDYLKCQYHLSDKIPLGSWTVYEYMGNDCSP
ncbi:4-amino-4-deoxy-L-arabinose transferase [Bellilinea caldifistulae]|uniref:Glycosyltransferase RgtA/B/C/D-like domain-containing protein n=1 Tax=Bellilinea caldifistulae TaxID=360411 RepID=A0A0P6XRZ7_9CHLR|nr:glycosyltransferase family 39 protein [Bellilinea caldifistulae]KPL75247.1 hypothetical protein AC812_09860 [Bellilinea caldifistulae]GAP09395.1 4-amino-4-deoxy-L-arabinose transferase [Bellilinea caldifistulae]